VKVKVTSLFIKASRRENLQGIGGTPPRILNVGGT